jgi:hypothetical protein
MSGHDRDRLQLEALLRLYFQLLDLSLDVERNRDDHAFRDEGGAIWYVFDENVLELFIDPRDPRGRITSLHGPEWRRAGHRVDRNRSTVAETTLATAEFLMSGDLPGQDGAPIYMTEWHRWEFARRVELLQARQVRELRGISPTQIRERFSPLRQILKLFDRDPEGIESHLENRQLAADIAAFKARQPTQDALRSYLATRLSIELLANDELLEPSHQIRRLVTRPLRQRIATLHSALGMISDEDKQAIALDAREWRKRLRAECARRGIDVVSGEAHVPRQRSRSEGAVWDDAKSLALVRWAAATKSRSSLDQRVVLVTADQVVFDAYREWHADLPMKDPAYAEPFCLRRITQYAPVFNLVSSGRVEGGEAYVELFTDLLQTLEVMLLPLNLSRIASRAPAAVLSRMREKTALRPLRKPSIVEDPAYSSLIMALQQEGVSCHRAQLDKIIDRWRELERATLGRPDEQMQVRIAAAEAMKAILDADDTGEAFERYVTDLVRTLLSGSRKLSLPLARECIEDWRAPPLQGVTRAPIALQLVVRTPNRAVSVRDLLDQHLGGADQAPLFDEAGWEALYEQPSLVFSIATAQCLATRDWGNAQHFAEMALLEEIESKEADPAALDQRAEIRYLYALVNRFRMGEIGPPLTGDAFGRLDRSYRVALLHLNECEIYHSRPEARQELRLMRALSERAALQLFFISATNRWVRLGAAQARQPPRHAGAREPELLELNCSDVALHALDSAEADLAACYALDRRLGAVEEPERADFRERVQRQYFTNIAAVAIFRFLWGQPLGAAPPILRPGNPVPEEAVREILRRYGDSAHPIMRADVWGFLALAGDPAAAEALRLLTPLRRGGGILSLDVAIIEAIRARTTALIAAGRSTFRAQMTEPLKA